MVIRMSILVFFIWKFVSQVFGFLFKYWNHHLTYLIKYWLIKYIHFSTNDLNPLPNSFVFAKHSPHSEWSSEYWREKKMIENESNIEKIHLFTGNESLLMGSFCFLWLLWNCVFAVLWQLEIDWASSVGILHFISCCLLQTTYSSCNFFICACVCVCLRKESTN